MFGLAVAADGSAGGEMGSRRMYMLIAGVANKTGYAHAGSGQGTGAIDGVTQERKWERERAR